MENNDSKKPAAAPAEPSSADRRAFMKTVVTGTVAAGLVASVGKAEAAQGEACGERTELPKSPVKAKILLNKNMQITRDDIINVIGGVFEDGHCPACGIFGWPGGGTVKDISLEAAYLPEGVRTLVCYQDDDGNGC